MADLLTDSIEPVQSLRDRALAVLRQATISGEIRVGEIYSVTALAKRLGVSLSPVREAMLTLVNEGIMEPVKNRGFRVAPMTEQDRWDVYELRVLLEVPTVAKLATMELGSKLDAVNDILDHMDELVSANNLHEFLRMDRTFHLHLLDLAGNDRLTGYVTTLRDQTRLYGMQTYALGLEESAYEHRKIVEAIEQGDRELTYQRMTQHLGHIAKEWAGTDAAAEPSP